MTNVPFLEAQLAFVTGVTSGIGAATTRALLEAGMRVVGVGRDAARLSDAAHDFGPRFQPLLLDLADADARRRALSDLGREPIRLLVNNAAECVYESALELAPERLARLFEINVIGLIDVTRAVTARMNEMSSLPLSAPLLQALEALAYTQMTPVQAQSLPAILAGRDLIGQAPTGSGKTVAFGLALLHRLDPALLRVQALVLCPTRELADQVAKEIRRLAAAIPNLKVLILTGGVPLGPQLASLRKDSHVVVGTPGRVQEMLRKQVLHLANVRTLVLDEADRMLDMGFEEPIF